MSTALYRRYRPDTFDDVIGQEHVTKPLMQALRSDRVGHAYLFSGPRGCGKTTSARILARCLNCAAGPTDTPCGTCESCVELARGGSGSIDVVEIDAASHNGVDDARELRERAAFAPARDRYKIFILDEAHMVTPQGFNALLKLVEEPPPHVRFIFATTEPEKVIGTIRSRTHHYPFRLVPPQVLHQYLQELCETEKVAVAEGVLPLVIRAGGGSVRDTLSLLDQLISGSEGEVSYAGAIGLLGFTDATLLHEAVAAIAEGNGAGLFDVVHKVIEVGLEPRRFVEDLLDRLRDLLVLIAGGSAGRDALGEVPADQAEILATQAAALGLVRASAAADLVNQALTEMVGATSPRLHLELLCARLIAQAQIGAGGGATPSSAPAAVPAVPPRAAAAPALATPTAAPAPSEISPAEVAPTVRATHPPAPAPEGSPANASPPAPTAAPEAPATAPIGAATTVGPADTDLLQRRWPEVLLALEKRRVSWAMISQSGSVARVTDGVVHIQFDTAPLAVRFASGNHRENLALAIREVLGLKARIEIDDPQTIAAPLDSAPSATVAPGNFSNPGRSPSPITPLSVNSTAGDTPNSPPHATAPPKGTAPSPSTAPARADFTPSSPRTPASAAGGDDSGLDEMSPDDQIIEESSGAELLASLLDAEVISEDD